MSTIRFDTRFPGYEVLSELGRSNARILKARHLATDDLVAIKHFALNTDEETLRRFQRESAIMTSISHPNIVKVREVQLEAELPYIVMELIEGGSVRQLITSQNRISIPTVIRLGLQMAEVFKAIHTQGIIHRDIKPENILYRPLPSGELHFLLTDFGVARLHEQSTTLTGQSLMTYEYASPEQFNDPRNLTPATDYYSLGVVLYECLHGSVPFALADHSGIVTFMNRVLTETPPALTVTSQDALLGPFVPILQDLLQKKPEERLSDPDELIWQLKQAELNCLKVGRGSIPASRPTPVVPLVSDPTSEPDAIPEPIASSSPVQREMPKPSGKSLTWTVLLLVILVGGAGLYYAFNRPLQKGVSSTNNTIGELQSTDSTAAETPVDSTNEDQWQQQQAEEARRQEELRQQALNAVEAGKSLTAEMIDFRVGFLGGIKNALIELNNPSNFKFPSVAVLVSYFKDNGQLYKTEKVFFNNVEPNSTRSRKAPDSDRGTRVSCKVLKYDFPKELDSLINLVPADSLTSDTLN
ncbi:serine/threonine-protein kinase [Spirosoma sp. SC4-14]|uniref:serine/threonine protein kinase n=1 Tax=Spirosoma sp. SC4-14 TaxID=3128900 RepID=UPI0030D21A21